MGFGCPKQPSLFNRSYGVFDIPTFRNTGMWTCNYLGVDPPQAGKGGKIGVTWMVVGMMVGVHVVWTII
jgi:hypothetical protein